VPSDGAVNFGPLWVVRAAGLVGARHVSVDLKIYVWTYIWTRVRLM
jgi:hypothetical protein